VPEIVGYDADGLIYRYVPGRSISPGVTLNRDGDRSADGVETPTLARRAGLTYGLLHLQRGRGLGAMQSDGGDPDWPPEAFFRVVPEQAARLLAQRSSETGISAADVETAAAILTRERWLSRSRLVHGDASPANTLIDQNNEIVAVIDFDVAAWADPAIDLAWWWYNSPETAEWFAPGCAEVSEPTDRQTVLLYRLRLLIGLADAVASTDAQQATRIGGLLAQTVAEFRAS
jgi:hypothetical protein